MTDIFKPVSFCNFCLELCANKCTSPKQAKECSQPKPKIHKQNDTSKTS